MDDTRDLIELATEIAIDHAFMRSCDAAARVPTHVASWGQHDLLAAADAVCALLLGESVPPALPHAALHLLAGRATCRTERADEVADRLLAFLCRVGQALAHYAVVAQTASSSVALW
jgi:hypothetical protein